LQNLAYLSTPKIWLFNDHVSHAFHHKLTIKHHTKKPSFLQNTPQKRQQNHKISPQTPSEKKPAKT
jgi:hypothetical protein